MVLVKVDRQHPSRTRRPGSGLLAMAGIAAVLVIGVQRPAAAADPAKPPLAYDASPEIYKIVSENDDFRVILATWPPGARDNFHNHPVSFVSYFVTDCSRRFHFPDGKTTDAMIKKGQVLLTGPVESHSFENTGAEACQILIVDKKR